MPHKRIDRHFREEHQKLKEKLIKKEIERQEKASFEEELGMMCRIYGDTYNDSLGFKKQLDKVRKILEGVEQDIVMNNGNLTAETFHAVKAINQELEGNDE